MRSAFPSFMTTALALALLWSGSLVVGSPSTAAVPAALSGDSWIWCSGPDNPHNAYAYFRRTFYVTGSPISVKAHITADNRYLLYVNGQRVGRGPARSHTANLAYDTYDVAPYLQPGTNVVAIIVHHFGDWTFRSQDARAGLLFDLAVPDRFGTRFIRSDGSWKTLPSAAWDPGLDKMDMQLGYPEIFDARAEPAGWMTASFDDSQWQAATVIGPAGIAPWVNLLPTDVPPPAESWIYPASLVCAMDVTPPPDAADLDLLPLFDRKGWAVAYAATYLYSAQPSDMTLELGNDDAVHAWLNGASVLDCPGSVGLAPAQATANVHLTAGWNRLLLKVVQFIGPWQVYFSLSGPGSADVVFSADQSLSSTGTWRVSQTYDYDGSAGMAVGYTTAFPPESSQDTTGWQLVTAPVAPLKHVAMVVHYEKRNTSGASQVGFPSTLTTTNGAATFLSASGMDGAVLLDFGREVLGFPTITVKGAAGGEVVDLSYAETLEDGSGNPVSPTSLSPGVLNPERGGVAYADRFVCRPGDNTFQTFEKRGFRYMQVDVRNAARPVTVSSAAILLSTYPADERGSFTCSDDRLNSIWDTSRWTLRLNMDDAFTDCPWRERAQWWGDTRIEALSDFYAFGDSALLRRGLLQGAESQDAEGLVHGVFPTDWTGARIPPFALMWVLSLWDYYLYTGDDSLLPRLMPVVDRVLAFFDGHMNPSLGLLEDVPYWEFIDWAPSMDGQRIGVSGSLNCLYYRALTVAASMAAWDADLVSAIRYAKRAAALRQAINDHLWSAEDGLYYDTLLNGQPTGAFSQHVQALAVDFGIAPPERWPALMDKAMSDPRVIPVGTPYFASYLLDALFAAGKADEAVEYVRDRWGAMLDWGATTFWEKWQPTDSLCHGWSTAPTRLLPGYVLGIRPTSPGWKACTISPNWAGLSTAQGVVPTPHGDIAASWARDSGGATVQVTVPDGTSADVRIPLAGLEGAIWTVNGSAALPDGVTSVSVVGSWAVRINRSGTYTIHAAITAR